MIWCLKGPVDQRTEWLGLVRSECFCTFFKWMKKSTQSEIKANHICHLRAGRREKIQTGGEIKRAPIPTLLENSVQIPLFSLLFHHVCLGVFINLLLNGQKNFSLQKLPNRWYSPLKYPWNNGQDSVCDFFYKNQHCYDTSLLDTHSPVRTERGPAWLIAGHL